MTKNNRILISGIHGVGKSMLCRKLEKKFDIEYLIASQLIYEYKQKQPPRNKRISDIQGNQDILIQALKMYSSPSKTQILEGHTCLLNKQNEVEKVREEVFHELSLSGIILITGDIPKILERAYHRDEVHYSPYVMSMLQKEEISYTEFISSKLNIPHLKMDGEIVENVEYDENIQKISELFQLKQIK